MPDRPVKLFYSYSHKDEDLRDRLEVHLAALKRNNIISEWHDRRIMPGSEWAGEIATQLDAADIILLLVSPDFLASEYCCDREVRRAMKRHEAGKARVVPVILRPVHWDDMPFSKLQALPRDGKPVTTWSNTDEAFESVAKGIRSIVTRLPPKKGRKARDNGMSGEKENDRFRCPGCGEPSSANNGWFCEKCSAFVHQTCARVFELSRWRVWNCPICNERIKQHCY